MRNQLTYFITGFLVLTAVCNTQSAAQVTQNDQHSRFHFAKSYIGLGFQGIPSGGKAFYPTDAVGSTSAFSMGSRLTPRLLIGGIHFWGRTDFFLNIPLTTFTDVSGSGFETTYSTGVETGALFYPWKLDGHGLRPYLGFSWASIEYQQKVTDDQKGVSKNLSRVFLKAGLSFQTSFGLLTMGATYLPNSSFSYALSRTQFTTVDLPRWSFQLSYRYLFDVTAHDHGENYGSKPRDGMNAFSIAIGPSAAFGIRQSSYLSNKRPYLDNPVAANLFPDISLGYHFFDLNASIRISYRRMVQDQSAFGITQHFTRHSISLEAIKFLFNYQGFVPYIGLFTGPEFLQAAETDRGIQTLNLKETKWTIGISAGWDIRPSPASPIVLRTNIRYAPFLSLDTPGRGQLLFDQLEVDFIQVVVYPKRLFN